MTDRRPSPLAIVRRARLRRALATSRVSLERTSSLQFASFAVLALVAATTIDGFTSKPSIYSTLVLAAFLAIAAIGQTLVILIGGIDLSVPALISATNLVVPMLAARGWSFGLVIAFVLIAGALVGALNGWLVKHVGASPLIVTLATGAVISGLALAWTQNGFARGFVPGWLSRFSSPVGETAGIGIPPIVVLWAAIVLVMAVVLHRMVSGRRLYAVGANQVAAELAGIRTTRIWAASFALSGASAALTGLLLTGFVGSATVGIGEPYLFTSLTAVLIGGTSLVGARGDYTRTALGALILTLITTILVARGAGVDTQEIIFGVLILVFVGLYGREPRLRDRV